MCLDDFFGWKIQKPACFVLSLHWGKEQQGSMTTRSYCYRYTFILAVGIHRGLGVAVSKVRSLRMDMRVWTPSLIQASTTVTYQHECYLFDRH